MNTISLKQPREVFTITFIDIPIRAYSVTGWLLNPMTQTPSTISFYINSVSVDHFDMQFVIVEWNKE